MRVRSYHKQAVQRNSPALHGLLALHIIFSICYTAPVWFTYLGIRWNKATTTTEERTWMTCVLVIWFLAEVVRLYLGRLANKQALFGELIAFLCMCMVPQLLLVCILLGLLPDHNDLELSVCVTQIILLVLECAAAANLLLRISRNNVVDFYVSLGSPYC